jgi:hypothetical protein
MDGFSWQRMILSGFPEIFLLVSLAVILSGGRYRPGITLVIALLYTPFLFLLRGLLPFGWHTVISLLFIPLLIMLSCGVSYKQALKWIVLLTTIIFMTEYFAHALLLDSGKSLDSLTDWQLVLLSVPSNGIMGLLLLMLTKADWRKAITRLKREIGG